MPGLTPQVWDKLERRPVVMALNPALLERPLSRLDPPVSTIVPPFPVEKLIAHFCYESPYADAIDQLREQLDKIRERFGLRAGDRLRIAIIGNESRMAVITGAAEAQDSNELDAFMVRRVVSERELGSHIEAALQRLDNIDLCPMSALPGAYSPKLKYPRRYHRLMRKVRAGIDRIPLKRLSREPTTMVKLPATVALYVREGRFSRWRQLPLEDRPSAHLGEADMLIDVFHLLRHDARVMNRRLPEGILVKVIGRDASRHCVADLPMLTTNQHERALDAGISAILLDARGVIWNVEGEPPLDEWAEPPVYGV